jgi:molecular chaperone GrpE
MGSIGPARRTAQPSDFSFRFRSDVCDDRPPELNPTPHENVSLRVQVAPYAIRAGPPTGLPKGKNLDETLKQELLGRFATYLDVIKPSEADVDAAPDGREEADLFSIFVELAGLRNETRTQSRLVKEAIDRFRDVFETLQSSHAMLEQELKRTRAEADNRERMLIKPLLLDIIDIRDRLASGLKPAATAMPRWYERFLANRQRETAEAWREGLRMTVRRIDTLLADRRVIPAETVGRPFDPRIATAVATVADPYVADGMVVEDVRPGFLWQGELLRLAEVVVAKRNA